MAEQNEKVELKVVDLKTLQIEGEAMNLDLTEDAWEFAAPPPKGVYDYKCFLAKDGVRMGYMEKDNPKSAYFNISLEIKVEGGEYDGSMAFPNLSTRVYRGKSNSTAAAFVTKCGFKVPTPITHKKLAEMVVAVLKKEPVLKVEIDWRGAYLTKDKDGNDKWENAANKYEDFPDDGKGGKEHIYSYIINKVTGESKEVKAQVKVVKFYGKGDTLPNPNAKKQGLVSAPRLAAPVLQPTSGPNLVPASSVDTTTVSNESSEDVDLLLEV